MLSFLALFVIIVGKQAPARFYGCLSEQVGCSGLASASLTSPRIRWAREVSSYDEFVGWGRRHFSCLFFRN